MNRTRALIVSLAVGLAAIAGVFALGHTLALSNATSSTTDQKVAQRTRQLNRYEASLRKTLAQKPPVLPAVPRAGSTGSTLQLATGTAAPGVASARVIYHRPPPVVVIKHRAGGDAETEYAGAEADD